MNYNEIKLGYKYIVDHLDMKDDEEISQALRGLVGKTVTVMKMVDSEVPVVIKESYEQLRPSELREINYDWDR
jgi:hypothetical protein